MPIYCPLDIRNLSNDEFKERDRLVMRCAFDSQNALGRLCEERVYEQDIVRRLRAMGFRSVETQVPIVASYGNYSTTLRVDLVADDAVYELKSVAALIQEHIAQALNYAAMLAVNHVKLINFRNTRVEGMLKYNAILSDVRRQIRVDDSSWCAVTEHCDLLRSFMLGLFADWRGYIDFRLYEGAAIDFCGGESLVKRRVPLQLDGLPLGAHEFCCHSNLTCFMVSGFSNLNEQLPHVKRLLHLTSFEAAQLINLHRETMTMHTLVRGA